MKIKPHPSGREFAGEGLYAKYCIVLGEHHGDLFDQDGQRVGRADVELREPPPASDEEIRKAIGKSAICEACEHSNAVTLTINLRPVYGVSCGKCGCGNLSLIHGQCPEGKWPALV